MRVNVRDTASTIVLSTTACLAMLALACSGA